MLRFTFLVLCTKSALAEKRVYQFTGTANNIRGFYVETEEPQIFQNLLDKDFYLFRHHKNLTEWRIGYGKDRREEYQASGGEDEPPEDGWKNMEGDSS